MMEASAASAVRRFLAGVLCAPPAPQHDAGAAVAVAAQACAMAADRSSRIALAALFALAVLVLVAVTSAVLSERRQLAWLAAHMERRMESVDARMQGTECILAAVKEMLEDVKRAQAAQNAALLLEAVPALQHTLSPHTDLLAALLEASPATRPLVDTPVVATRPKGHHLGLPAQRFNANSCKTA